MKYKIRHATTYTYSSSVSMCHNLVMLMPRDDARVKVHHHRLNTYPAPQFSSRRKDAYGNHVHSFSIEESHKQLTVVAQSRVTVHAPETDDDQGCAWEQVAEGIRFASDQSWLEASEFAFDSPRVRRSLEFGEYARISFRGRRPILDAVHDFTSRIHQDFTYDKASTHVGTAAEEAFRLRAGVCQDFAHIQIAGLRSLGIPSRYVSGYLRTVAPPGQPSLIGADQSHAWVGVYCGADLGWVDVDPTNNCLCTTDHITVAWGRDYGDVVPLRGVFLGGGEHQLKVAVDVTPIDGPGASVAADSNSL